MAGTPPQPVGVVKPKGETDDNALEEAAQTNLGIIAQPFDLFGCECVERELGE